MTDKSMLFSWPADDDGQPKALISTSAVERIPNPKVKYAYVEIEGTITRYVSDDMGSVSEYISDTHDQIEKALSSKRDEVLEDFEKGD